MENEPHVSHLLTIVRSGDEARKQELMAELRKMMRLYIEAFPVEANPNERYVPMANGYKGPLAYPYLLAMLDGSTDTLRLIVKMHERSHHVHVERMRKALEKRKQKKPQDPLINPDQIKFGGSKEGIVFSQASERCLSALSRKRTRNGPPQDQNAILDEYERYLNERANGSWNYLTEQGRILDFATRLVKAVE